MTSEIQITVNPSQPTTHGCAGITLRISNGAVSQLHVDFESLQKGLREPTPEVQDFLLLGAVIYAADKLVLRKSAEDLWARNITVVMPVSDPDRWTGLASDINDCIGFLTGDNWCFSFKK